MEFVKKETRPENFKFILENLMLKGYWVLGNCSRVLEDNYKENDFLNLYKNMDFSGLFVFKNKIQKQTISLIKELKLKKIYTFMLTED